MCITDISAPINITSYHANVIKLPTRKPPSMSFVTITIRLARCNQTISQKSLSVLSIGPAAKP